MAIAGLFITVCRPGRRLRAAALASGVVVAAAAIAGWWLKLLPQAVAGTGGIEACGVLLGLAAVPLCQPGPARQRALLLGATVVLCVLGAAIIWPASSVQTIVF